MTNEDLTYKAKELRSSLEDTLYFMKEHKQEILVSLKTNNHPNSGEVIAQHTISIRDLESAIMRQELVIKELTTTNHA